MPITTTYEVSGMTCGHCATAVTTELRQLAGVREVSVDLTTGGVTVTADAPLPVDDVRRAVDEAGYELARAGA
jgi:copper chaperone CopZ